MTRTSNHKCLKGTHNGPACGRRVRLTRYQRATETTCRRHCTYGPPYRGGWCERPLAAGLAQVRSGHGPLAIRPNLAYVRALTLYNTYCSVQAGMDQLSARPAGPAAGGTVYNTRHSTRRRGEAAAHSELTHEREQARHNMTAKYIHALNTAEGG